MPGYRVFTDTLLGCCLSSEPYAAFSSHDLKTVLARVTAYKNQYLFCDTSIAAMQKVVNSHPDWFLFETESSVAKTHPEEPLPMRYLCFGVEDKLIQIFMDTAKSYLWQKAKDTADEFFSKSTGTEVKEIYDSKDRYLAIPEAGTSEPVWILKKNGTILPAAKEEAATSDMVCLYRKEKSPAADNQPVPTDSTSMAQTLSRHTEKLDSEKKKQDIRQANAFLQEKDTIIP